MCWLVFFNATATTEIYTYLHTLSLHDARPISLAGLAGDDIYHIYGTSNRVVEGAAAGTDTVKTWMSYQLPDNIENLTVTGSGRQASGNGLDNIISGGNGRQTLDGGPGDDVLIGKAGADRSEESRGGKGGVSRCRTRGAPDHLKK